MRKFRLIALFLLLSLLAACASAPKGENEAEQLRWVDVYYENLQGGALVASEPCGISTEGGVTAMLRRALEMLCADPVRAGLQSPLPPATQLREVRFSGDGLVAVFSEDYAALTGVRRSIANACVVMTVANFWSVESVTIYAGEQVMAKNLRARDVVTAAARAFSGAQTIFVYLQDAKSGALTPIEQTVLLQDDVLPERAAAQELLSGAKDGALTSPLPAGTELLSIDTDGGTCYVNFSGALTALDATQPRAEQEMRIVRAIVLTLTSIDYIDRVSISIDGAQVRGFETFDLRNPLEANNVELS